MSADTTTEAPERDAVAEMRAEMLADGWTPERTRVRSEAYRDLQRRHPKMYALIREKWTGDQLVQPYLIAVAPTHGELRRVAESLPVDQREGASICFVIPEGAALGY